MADAALKDQLKAIISKATGGAVSVAAIGDDVALMDLGVDSMAALEVVMELEMQFGVSITDMEAGKEAFTSINSLANFVEANRS
ncbi:acyl-carrier protein [Candidatus Vecturithrix granuli]|uniref:Acyl-carrier protein n=1 Tax=Vecturithrix granuli TaxID=1499967 RepID=A0A081BU29_VECG1|nr:acyl-carrier protein [Candidatus Vecturithrix granuli]